MLQILGRVWGKKIVEEIKNSQSLKLEENMQCQLITKKSRYGTPMSKELIANSACSREFHQIATLSEQN